MTSLASLARWLCLACPRLEVALARPDPECEVLRVGGQRGDTRDQALPAALLFLHLVRKL